MAVRRVYNLKLPGRKSPGSLTPVPFLVVYEKPPVRLRLPGDCYSYRKLFYDFFVGLDGRELFVQIASPSVLGFSAFDKFLREFRVVAH